MQFRTNQPLSNPITKKAFHVLIVKILSKYLFFFSTDLPLAEHTKKKKTFIIYCCCAIYLAVNFATPACITILLNETIGFDRGLLQKKNLRNNF